MLSYDLKISYKCNNNCIHCVIRGSRTNLLRLQKNIELDINECITLIEEQGDGLVSIVLTGGEPTLHPNFVELLQECSRRKLSIVLQTNGRLIGSPEILEVIKDTPNLVTVIALHSYIAKKHDAITQAEGSFDETLTGIRALRNAGVNVTAKMVLSRQNVADISEMPELLNELDVEKIVVAFPHSSGWSKKNYLEIVPRYSELRKSLRLFIENACNKNVKVKFETIPFCIIPNTPQLIGEIGYDRLDRRCTQVGEPTYNWGTLRRKIKHKPAQCKKCAFNPLCEGVWREYFDFYPPDDFVPLVADKHWKSHLEKLSSQINTN